MKNYYEILEVDKNASSEVIDKAYKVLAKKYHPDMHSDDTKVWAEEQFKKISIAYDILSDETKREKYNQELESTTIDYSKKYEALRKEQELLKQELEFLRNKYQSNNTSYNQTIYNNSKDINAAQNIYYSKNINNEHNIENIKQQEYYRAYNNILQSLGYKIRQKKTFKDFFAFILTFFFIVLFIYILWNIPFTKNYLIEFYESNDILKAIINFFNT